MEIYFVGMAENTPAWSWSGLAFVILTVLCGSWSLYLLWSEYAAYKELQKQEKKRQVLEEHWKQQDKANRLKNHKNFF